MGCRLRSSAFIIVSELLCRYKSFSQNLSLSSIYNWNDFISYFLASRYERATHMLMQDQGYTYEPLARSFVGFAAPSAVRIMDMHGYLEKE